MGRGVPTCSAMQRRKHGRIRTQGVTATLRRGTEILSGLIVENLSMGGAFVRTSRAMHEGSQVAVGLSAPGKPRPIRLGGRVVSVTRSGGSSPPGVGICFEYCSPETAAELHALLIAHAPGPMVLEGDAGPAKPKPPEADSAPTAHPVPVLPARAGKKSASNAATARLAVQVKWLLLELHDWRAQAAMLEARNQALQAQIERLLAALQIPER